MFSNRASISGVYIVISPRVLESEAYKAILQKHACESFAAHMLYMNRRLANS
jgi:hypothetical protein